MKKKLAGLALAASLSVGAVGPFTGTAHANGDDDTTDPFVCFAVTFAVVDEALHEFREGHLSAADLRSVLQGASGFLLDCLFDI